MPRNLRLKLSRISHKPIFRSGSNLLSSPAIVDSRAMPMSLQDVLDAWDRTRTDLSGECDCASCTDIVIPRQVLSEALFQHRELLRGHGRARESTISGLETLRITEFLFEWLHRNVVGSTGCTGSIGLYRLWPR